MSEDSGSLMTSLKSFALRILPERLLSLFKRAHYRNVVAHFQEKDEPDMLYVRKLVDPGDLVFDIGANIGVYTRFLSEFVGAGGKVHSFEPIPPTFDYLRSNVRGLRLRNVELHAVALSDSSGSETMCVPTYETGGNNFYQASLLRASDASGFLEFEVRTQTLDEIWHDIGKKLSFAKIDVEGAELSCIHGARDCLASDRPALLIEISGNMTDELSAAAELKGVLGDLGYRAYYLSDQALKPWEPGVKSVNYFFLSAPHEKKLGLNY